jgi:hypothetical protein
MVLSRAAAINHPYLLLPSPNMATQQSSIPPNAQVSGNVLTLEVDNILNGWPTYIIHFTPEQPGPLVSVSNPLRFALNTHMSHSRSSSCASKMHPSAYMQGNLVTRTTQSKHTHPGSKSQMVQVSWLKCRHNESSFSTTHSPLTVVIFKGHL